MTAKLYHVHVIEGTSFRKYTDEKSGEYTEDFEANILNTWVWSTAEMLHQTMVDQLGATMTLDWFKQALEEGTNCLVIDHSDSDKGRINLRFMPEPQVIP